MGIFELIQEEEIQEKEPDYLHNDYVSYMIFERDTIIQNPTTDQLLSELDEVAKLKTIQNTEKLTFLLIKIIKFLETSIFLLLDSQNSFYDAIG